MRRQQGGVGVIPAGWWWLMILLLAAAQKGSDAGPWFEVIVSVLTLIGMAYAVRRWWVGEHPLRLSRSSVGEYPPSYELRHKVIPQTLRITGSGERSVLLQVDPRLEGELSAIEFGLFEKWSWLEAIMPSLLNRKIPGIDEISDSRASVVMVTSHSRFLPLINGERDGGRYVFSVNPPLKWDRHQPVYFTVRVLSNDSWKGQVAMRANYAGRRAHVRQTVEVAV